MAERATDRCPWCKGGFPVELLRRHGGFCCAEHADASRLQERFGVAPPLVPAASETGHQTPESRARAADARGTCRWCGQPLTLLARLRGEKFCSESHERQHRRQQAELFLERVKKYRRQGGGSKLRSESTKIIIRPAKQTRAAEAQPSRPEGLRRSELPESWRETLLPLAAAAPAEQLRTGQKPGRPHSLPPPGLRRSSGGSCSSAELWMEPDGPLAYRQPCPAVQAVMGGLEHPRVELEQAGRYDAGRAAMTTLHRLEIWWENVLWTPPRLPGAVVHSRTASTAGDFPVRPAMPQPPAPPRTAARPALSESGAARDAFKPACTVCFASLRIRRVHVPVYLPGRVVLRRSRQPAAICRAGIAGLGLPQQWKAGHGLAGSSPRIGAGRLPALAVQSEMARLPVHPCGWRIPGVNPTGCRGGAGDPRWEPGLDPFPQNGWTTGCRFPRTAASAPGMPRVSPAGPMSLRFARTDQGRLVLWPAAAGSSTEQYRRPGSCPPDPAASAGPVLTSLAGLPCRDAPSASGELRKHFSMPPPPAGPSRAEGRAVPGSEAHWNRPEETGFLAVTLSPGLPVSGMRIGKHSFLTSPLPAPAERISLSGAGSSWAGGFLASIDAAREIPGLPGFGTPLRLSKPGTSDLSQVRIRLEDLAASASFGVVGWREDSGLAPARLPMRFGVWEWGMFWPGNPFLLFPLPPPEGRTRFHAAAGIGSADWPGRESGKGEGGPSTGGLPDLFAPSLQWGCGAQPARPGWLAAGVCFAPVPGAAGRPGGGLTARTGGQFSGPEMRFGLTGRLPGLTGWRPKKAGAAEAWRPALVQGRSGMGGRAEWREESGSAPPEIGAVPGSAAFQSTFWQRPAPEVARASRAASGRVAFRRERLRLPHLYCRFPVAHAIQVESGVRRPIGLRPGDGD